MANISKINFKGVEYDIKPLTDATPTQGSTNAVQSGGVYEALQIKGDVKSVNAIEPDASGNVEIETGGLPDSAVTLLIEILTAGVYTSDQSGNIEGLIIALGGLPVTWEKAGRALVFRNVTPITSITQDNTTLVCA